MVIIPPPNPKTVLKQVAQQLRQNMNAPLTPNLPGSEPAPVVVLEYITHRQQHPENGACPVCGFPPGAPGYLRHDVAPDDPLFGKLTPCPQCHGLKTVGKSQLRGQLDGSLTSKTFANYGVTDNNREGYNAARLFAKKPAGWLTFYGDNGPGKTHLMAAIVNLLGDNQAKYFNLPDLVSRLRADCADADRLIRELITIPVLAIDELDKANLPHGWTREQVQRIFDSRYRTGEDEQTGLVLAMNNSPENLPDELQFLASRIRDEQFFCVKMTGDNRPFKKKLTEIARTQQPIADLTGF